MSGGDGILTNLLSLYALPGIVALATKILIFWLARYSFASMTYWFWSFLSMLFGMNVFELVSIAYSSRPEHGVAIVIAYHLCAVGTFCSLLGFSLQITGHINRLLSRFIGLIVLVNAFVLFIPGMALAGAESIGYSLTRIAGPYYWVLQISIVSTLIWSLIALLRCSFFSKDWLRKRRALAILIAIVPLFTMVIFVVVCMQLGWKINGSVVISITVNIMLAVLLYAEKQHRLFHFLSLIPSTRENHMVNDLSLILSPGNMSFNDAKAWFEYEFVKKVVMLCDGNKNKAAETLGISYATLLRKLYYSDAKTKALSTPHIAPGIKYRSDVK